MWLGVDASMWGQLWSGVIGSFAAAVVGGLVALGVVRLTNRQQSRLAKDARARAAAADVAAAMNAMDMRAHKGDMEIVDLYLVASAASVRWRMDNDDRGLDRELNLWPGHMAQLVFAATGRRSRGKRVAEKTEIDRLLKDAVLEFETFAIAWPNASEVERRSLVRRLEATRKEGEAVTPVGKGSAVAVTSD